MTPILSCLVVSCISLSCNIPFDFLIWFRFVFKSISGSLICFGVVRFGFVSLSFVWFGFGLVSVLGCVLVGPLVCFVFVFCVWFRYITAGAVGSGLVRGLL